MACRVGNLFVGRQLIHSPNISRKPQHFLSLRQSSTSSLTLTLQLFDEMPLVRFQVRNEYGLGAKEMHEAASKDDPKALLDGLAVTGLVGILRQLGDLAEFAAGIFHDLQEQAMVTASRSQKIMVRVQQLEAAVPPLEKAVFSQKSHIHFAYTAGSEWYSNCTTDQNHIVNSNLPPFIMDSYEECQEPPSLHLLDKFDSGGPGACLKRYSDPSFFKRALASSGFLNAEKFQVEKKARRNKKNGMHQRKIAVPRPVIISQQNDSHRMQFTSPNMSQKTSMARTTSISRSELSYRSTSFDSRSDYIESVCEASSCMPHKEQEHHRLTTSRLKMQYDCTDCPVSPREQNGGANDHSPHHEQRMAKFSRVTWDEKTEIVKSTSQRSNNTVEDKGRISELMPAIDEQNKLEKEVAKLENAYSDTSLCHNENVVESLSDGNLSEEDEIESDSYMDALNTTTSEIETDAEKPINVKLPCRNSKRNTDCGTGNDILNEMTSHSPASACVEPFMVPESQDTLNTSEDLVLPKKTLISGTHPNSNFGIDLSEVAHPHNLPRVNNCEILSSDLLSSELKVLDSQTSVSEKFIPEGSFAETSGRSFIQLWTNGGLLGLEPSKPPDFSVLDSVKENLTSTNIDEDSLSSANMRPETHIAEPTRKLGKRGMASETIENQRPKEETVMFPCEVALDQLVKSVGHISQTIDSFECSTPWHEDNFISQDNSGESSTSFEGKLDKGDKSVCSSKFSDSHGHGLADSRVMNYGSNVQISPDVNGSYRDPSQDMEATSSSVFHPNYRLLANSFQRKVSLSHGDTPEVSSSARNDINEDFKHGSPTNSISSPPLEHMRISFYPVDGSETSKLKLKFRDGCHPHEYDKNNDGIFPSFQLLPKPVSPLKDIDFGSDDDTFSRSSDYISDGLSEPSESNSEQWACDRIPGDEDSQFYVALHRVPSTESISRSSDIEGVTDDAIYPDDDFRSPETKNDKSFHNDSLRDISNKELPLGLQFTDEPMPPPPPLPPLQWRVIKPQVNIVEARQGGISEAVASQNIQQAPVSNMPQQSNISPEQQQDIMDSPTCPPKNKQDQQKLNGQRVSNDAQNGETIDEKEDFLHQIRSKSFSLRPTLTAKPASTPGPVPDMKVTAILQKANSIRQAFVGSDDEDNEDWSNG